MLLLRIILLLSILTGSVSARLYWVFFEDDASRPKVQLTEKAYERLAKRGTPNVQGDRAVSPAHLSKIKSAGYRISTVSRFLNAASVEIEDQGQLNQISNLSFVSSVSPVASRIVNKPIETLHKEAITVSTPYYGDSFTQNQILDVPTIHSYGYDGSGVLVAVFDTGFDTIHPVFDRMEIIDQYDFVDKELDVDGNRPLNEHGTQVLSVLGGYSWGELIGPAFGSSFILARTEDDLSETRIEEQNWLAAVEWADSLGADIISSSLAYFDFDGTRQDYPDKALDGNTTVVALAAKTAAERGILVVNAIGNEGSNPMSLWSPADSPFILSVGAIYASGDITNFSSRGPTYDGRIKPDVVAMGSSVVIATGTGSFIGGAGTSYATPLISGLAALLLQSHSDLTPDSVISIFRQNGDNGESPNNTYGWGVPKLLSYFDEVAPLSSNQCLVYPNPTTGKNINILLPDPVSELIEEVHLFDILGRHVADLALEASSAFVLQGTLPRNKRLADQLYLISVKAGEQNYIGKFIYINP